MDDYGEHPLWVQADWEIPFFRGIIALSETNIERPRRFDASIFASQWILTMEEDYPYRKTLQYLLWHSAN